MISDKLAAEVINTAIKTGCDFAEIFNEDSYTDNLNVENGKVQTVSSFNVSGVGLRLLKGFQSVYGFTNDVSKKSLIKLANDLSLSFHEDKMLNDVTSFKKVHHKNNFLRNYQNYHRQKNSYFQVNQLVSSKEYNIHQIHFLALHHQNIKILL